MATYAELYALSADSSLRNKITVACLVAAEAIRTESVNTTNHVARLAWAKATMSNPADAGEKMFNAVIAQNAAATVAQIQGALDATIQTAVNNAVDLLT